VEQDPREWVVHYIAHCSGDRDGEVPGRRLTAEVQCSAGVCCGRVGWLRAGTGPEVVQPGLFGEVSTVEGHGHGQGHGQGQGQGEACLDSGYTMVQRVVRASGGRDPVI
jgi:hypothetical protein